MARFTDVEQGFDDFAHRILAKVPLAGPRAWLAELIVFVAKLAWACVFGGALLAVLIGARLWYPTDATLARNDFLTIAAVVIQVVMVVARLETLRELRVIILFHLVGTGMELFKTSVGSWEYGDGGVLHVLSVPLFSGFMYAAVGSFMVRVFRLFDLRFDRYPRRWITAVLASLIYLNFFGHHYIYDLRWVLLAGVAVLYLRCIMHFRVFRVTGRMPILVAFLLVATFIWVAENIATWSHAWTYPNQVDAWELVAPTKLVSWYLLMIISVVLVAWVYPPRPPTRVDVVATARHDRTMGKVQHFEIPADDLARAKKFYGEIFGWKYEEFDDELVFVNAAGDEGETGVIGGDIYKRDQPQAPTFVITVDSIEDTLEQILKSGGQRLGAIEILPGEGRYTYFTDPEGNRIGLWDSKI